MSDRSNSIAIECVTGDISNQPEVDAVVNAANAELMPGVVSPGRFIGRRAQGWPRNVAPWRRSGPGRPLSVAATICPTNGSSTVWGRYTGWTSPPRDCWRPVTTTPCEWRRKKGIASIAFPAISTGAFGYPPEQAAEVCAEAVKQALSHLERVRLIRFVLFDDSDREILQRVFADVGLINP